MEGSGHVMLDLVYSSAAINTDISDCKAHASAYQAKPCMKYHVHTRSK